MMPETLVPKELTVAHSASPQHASSRAHRNRLYNRRCNVVPESSTSTTALQRDSRSGGMHWVYRWRAWPWHAMPCSDASHNGGCGWRRALSCTILSSRSSGLPRNRHLSNSHRCDPQGVLRRRGRTCPSRSCTGATLQTTGAQAGTTAGNHQRHTHRRVTSAPERRPTTPHSLCNTQQQGHQA